MYSLAESDPTPAREGVVGNHMNVFVLNYMSYILWCILGRWRGGGRDELAMEYHNLKYCNKNGGGGGGEGGKLIPPPK